MFCKQFNVIMVSFDIVEVCELVALYSLDILQKEFGDIKISFYRDDGLSCFQNLSVPESEKIKKNFKQHMLNLTIEFKLRIKDLLDVIFDLQT